MRSVAFLLAVFGLASAAVIVNRDDFTDNYGTPTGAPYSGLPYVPQCSCNKTAVWNDVVFIIDASEASTKAGFDQMWGFVQTVCDWFNVQTSSYTSTPNYMRVGVITYASKANVISPLGSWNGNDIDNMDELPFNDGDQGTNLEAAIQAASDQFKGSQHRTNSKKVMIIFASSYNDGGYNKPTQAADTFKEGGGIIMVYNYVQAHGGTSALIQALASPGYAFDNENDPDSLTSLENAQCDANCFCAPNYASYSQAARQYPTGGCFAASEIQNNFRIAGNNCKRVNNGFVSPAESANKTAFLQTQLLGSVNYYIGLSWNSAAYQWVWNDPNNTALGNGYSNWISGGTPTGSSSLACAYIQGTSGLWVPTDCRNGYVYICEIAPCDSVTYCS